MRTLTTICQMFMKCKGNDDDSFAANLQAVKYNTRNIKAYIQMSEKMMARGRNEDD